MSFAVVLEGMTFVSFVVMLSSGVQKRMNGWKILATFLVLVGSIQCIAMALIVGRLFCLIFLVRIDHFRRTFTMWIIDSSLVGISISVSSSVHSAGRWNSLQELG